MQEPPGCESPGGFFAVCSDGFFVGFSGDRDLPQVFRRTRGETIPPAENARRSPDPRRSTARSFVIDGPILGREHAGARAFAILRPLSHS